MKLSDSYTPLGILVGILVLYMISRSSTGHEVIYYALLLILVFLVVNNYNKIMPQLIKNWKSA